MNWTDERVERLKVLWQDGLSCSKIAAELGGFEHCGDRGRSAVIGKVHRLGLSGRARPSSAPRPRKPRSNVRRVFRPTRNSAVALLHEMVSEPEVEVIDDMIIPFGQRRTLLELTEDTCRWPIGDPATPDFFFCGGKPVSSLPYCAYHACIAYQPGSRS